MVIDRYCTKQPRPAVRSENLSEPLANKPATCAMSWRDRVQVDPALLPQAHCCRPILWQRRGRARSWGAERLVLGWFVLKTERTSELGPCEPSQHAKDSYTQTCALVHGLSLSDSAISSRPRRRGMHRRRATEVGGLGKHMGGCRLAVFPGQSNAVLENPNFTPAMGHSGCGNESQPSGSQNCGVDVNTVLGSTQMQPHAGCIPTLHHTNELYIGVSCLSTTLLRGISRKPCCNLF